MQFGHPGPSLEGIIVSIYNLGCFSGCILSFIFCEKTGRRLAMWIAMVFIIVSIASRSCLTRTGLNYTLQVGAALQTSAFTVPHIMIARFVTGIGTGIETSTVPMYQSELCEASKRGRLVSSEPLFVGVGIEIAYWFDYGMSFVPGSIAWRLPIACQMIFAFIVIAMVFGLPESPRYLYAHGKEEEALAILCKVYDRPADDAKIAKEQGEILEALKIEKEHGEYRWSNLLKRDEVQTGRRVLLAYGMQFMNQMGGINLVVYYITSVLQLNVGLSRQLSLLLGGVINAMFFFGSLFPTFFLVRITGYKSSAPPILPCPSGQTKLMRNVTGQVWPSQAHDVGIIRARYLDDVDIDPTQLPEQGWGPRKVDIFCQRDLLFHIHAYIRCHRQLHSLGICARDPPIARQSKRDSCWYILKLALELFRCHGHSNTSQQLGVEGLPYLHGSQLRICSTCVLLLP